MIRQVASLDLPNPPSNAINRVEYTHTILPSEQTGLVYAYPQHSCSMFTGDKTPARSMAVLAAPDAVSVQQCQPATDPALSNLTAAG